MTGPDATWTRERFQAALNALVDAVNAVEPGRVTHGTIEAHGGGFRSTVNGWLTGGSLPQTEEALTALVTAVAELAQGRGNAFDTDVDEWKARLRAVRRTEALQRSRHRRGGDAAAYLAALPDEPAPARVERRFPAKVDPVLPDAAADAVVVGRNRERDHLLALLEPRGSTPVVSLAGGPGVGKTTLALAVGRAAAGRDWFPGGVWSANLRGYDVDEDEVVWPTRLYPSLRRRLAASSEDSALADDEQAVAYHQRLEALAARGSAVLLVLDNVADVRQVAPLLPDPASPHRVLVTSRHTLARLPRAVLPDLEPPDPEAAVAILDALMRGHRPEDQRVGADRDTARRLVELCGRLPLAMEIVAALLEREPDRPLSALVVELRQASERLNVLNYDGQLGVRMAYDVSRRQLSPEQDEVFRLLAAVPGVDAGLDVAAAVAGRTTTAVRPDLMGLCRAHLLDHTALNRWRQHDLIRLYAAEKLTEVERQAGFGRVLDYYRRTVARAARLVAGVLTEATPGGEFASPADVTAWVQRERDGLVATVLGAVVVDPDACYELAATLAPLLDRAHLLDEWLRIAKAVADASAAEPQNVVRMVNLYGLALAAARRFNEAVATHERGLALAQSIDDVRGEARATQNLGLALRELGRFDLAVARHREARDLFATIGDRTGEGQAWNGLAVALLMNREFPAGIEALEQARAAFRDARDRQHEAEVMTNLGLVYLQVGRADEAITILERARDRFAEMDYARLEGIASDGLGVALRIAGRPAEAVVAHERHLAVSERLGDRAGAGAAWNNLGIARQELGALAEAVRAHKQAIRLFAEVGDRRNEAGAWNNLGQAQRKLGHLPEAVAAHERAERLSDGYGAAQAAENLGIALQESGRPVEAAVAWRRAQAGYAASGGAEADVERIAGYLNNEDS